MAELTIDRRFRGPPDSANGGYTCGVVAGAFDGGAPVEVTLREPPPLDTPMTLEGGAAAELSIGETLIAEGREAAAPDVDLPEPISLAQAERAMEDSPLHQRHAFAGCFVCGTERLPGDGLCIVCGPVPGRELIGAPWRTDESMAGESGEVRRELVWSALDCPSGLAGMLVPDLGLTVLGRLTAELRRPLPAGRDYVAVGWPLERDGRKLHSASAILDESGEPFAVAAATWIELRDRTPGWGAT
jgi:hypothetical protein